MVTAAVSRLGIVGQRDFGVLWLGRALSLVGDYAFRVALITYLVSATRSAWSVGLAGAILVVPSLVFYLWGGAIGDRATSRKRLMIVADLGRFAATIGMVIAVSLSARPPVVVAFALLIGVGDGFYQPASFAIMTDVVPAQRLVEANSAFSIAQQFGLIVGPLLGGVIVGADGPGAAFGFDATTFLVSAGCTFAVRLMPRAHEQERAGADSQAVTAEIADGLRYVLSHRWLVISFAVGAVGNAVFTGNLDVSIPFVLSPHGMGQAVSLGGFYASEGAGALVGAVILARLTITRVGSPMFAVMTGMALSMVTIGAIGTSSAAYVMGIVYGMGLHFFNSLFPAAVQEKVPPELMSRVGSAEFLAFNGLAPLGVLVMGPLVTALGAAPSLLLGSGGVAVACAATALTPSIRQLRLRSPHPGTADAP